MRKDDGRNSPEAEARTRSQQGPIGFPREIRVAKPEQLLHAAG